MANGTAKVNLGPAFNVYDGTNGEAGTGNIIGRINQNECYCDDSVYYPSCFFLNSSGRVVPGFMGKHSNQGNFHQYVSNGSTLTQGTPVTINGTQYILHTLKKAQPWFLGSTNKGTLPVGTRLGLSSTTGFDHPYRLRLLIYSTNNGATYINPNTTDNAWIDFISLGSAPSTRAIW